MILNVLSYINDSMILGCPPWRTSFQSPFLHLKWRPRKCPNCRHIISNHCWFFFFFHFEWPASALVLCFIHGQQETISFIIGQEHIQLNWQTVLHFPITLQRTSFLVKRSPEVIEILRISFTNSYTAESVISIWISWYLLFGLFVVRCHQWWWYQKGCNTIDSKGSEVKGNKV